MSKPIFIHEDSGTQFKVVTANELEQATAWGDWKLDRMFEETELLPGFESALKPAPLNGGYYNPGDTTVLSKLIPGARAKFLLKKEVSTVIKELTDRVGAAEARSCADAQALIDLQKHYDLRAKELADTKKLAEERWGRMNALDIDVKNARDSKTKMENDIGKIRKAIGEIRLKEILEPGK